MAKKIDAPEMMDPSAPEAQEAPKVVHTPRTAYALQTLIDEVEVLFPEVTYETSEPDGRFTHKAVLFAAHETPEKFPALMELTLTDPRVQFVVHDKTEQVVYVRVFDNPRTQDDRAPFDLASAWDALTGPEDSGDDQ